MVLLFVVVSPMSLMCQESGGTVSISVDLAAEQWTISKYLNGSHFVYAFERDALYRDERIAEWMRKSKVGVIRWPGGTAVQTYHWDQLNGIAFKVDRWEPGYSVPSADPKDFMDLDEYITYCRRVGAEPMVGINIKSGKLHKREQDGLDEARRLIQYCKDKQYGVKFWYIGNECYIGFTAEKYVEYIQRYSEVLRAVAPDITVIGDWKFGPEEKHRFGETVKIATQAKQLDVMELHEKWGNDWGLASGKTVEDWRKEFPLYDGRLGDCIRRFLLEMKKTGRDKVQVALNEWGIGGLEHGTLHENALLAADYLIEVYRNRVYQACYWNLNMGGNLSRVLDTRDNQSVLVKLNPVAHVFEMLAPALERKLLLIQSSRKDVYGFAARDSATGALWIYLLNKSATPVAVKLALANGTIGSGDAELQSLVDPGEVKTSAVAGKDGSTPEIALPPWSFNRIAFETKK